MGSSNYVTFGEFNKPEPPPPQNMYDMNMHNDDYSEGYNQIPNQNIGYNYQQQPPQLQQPAKYPIRQHVPYPRNPVVPQAQPKFYDNPYYYQEQPKQNMIEPYTMDMSFPSLDTTTTPIAQALTTTPSSLHEMTPQQKSFRSPNQMKQTCVDINDHVVNCPICSQYYQNYSSMYIGIIILLGFIILIFLLKSIMEIKR